ncbi:putative short-chain dehydrogenase reductase [Phaeomoniella chlamydospora]|uniref:Putative short-chain dehydrogenase reductase n=1 Tax=Phaeomoniella chlamydospora TaxID=158046 RepID=A0A0G2F3I5_PHACM|nr:putative short-chain dehydrogenase reductase [Phaeomoniella chlamydospora]
MTTYENLTGKVALITGGTKGIGAALAFRLRQAGANIVVSYNSDSAGAEAFVSQHGGPEHVLAVKADAGSVTDSEVLVQKAVEKFGKISILVPMAGILHMADLAGTTEETFDTAYRINVKGPYFLVQKAVPFMETGGKIVLISTTQNHASSVTPPYLLYCSTKGAIEQMTRILSKDLIRAPKHISINCVAPGPTATELFLKGKSEQVLNMIKGLNPQGKIGEPNEVADAIALLCGEQSRWITGQVVRVNGGVA